jgi:hypothetical protein
LPHCTGLSHDEAKMRQSLYTRKFKSLPQMPEHA